MSSIRSLGHFVLYTLATGYPLRQYHLPACGTDSIGLLVSPWPLGLLVIEVIGTALLADGAVGQVIKHGPFGTIQPLPQMNDPLQYSN